MIQRTVRTGEGPLLKPGKVATEALPMKQSASRRSIPCPPTHTPIGSGFWRRYVRRILSFPEANTSVLFPLLRV